MSDNRHMQWAYDVDDEAIYNANGERIATAEPASGPLMAAAPKLLALLKDLVDIEGPQPGHVEWSRRVLATIAEAEAAS